MRVALDAGFLHLPPSGTGTYVRELAAAVRELDPALDLILLHPGGSKRPSSAAMSRRRRLGWDLIGVALAARRARPDLLHIPHFSVPFGVPRGLPLVVTVHDAIPLAIQAYRASRAARLRLLLARRGIRRAQLVLTPSRAAADDIQRLLGIPRERIRVTPEAAGRAYVPAPDPGSPAARATARRFGVQGRYVFNVGGLDVRKNVPTLLEAFALVLPRLQEPVQLVIAGAAHSDNPTVFPPLEPTVSRLDLASSVVFTGFVTEAEKVALYQGADLYVTPSLYEGFGLSVLEAMACGVPVIAANRTSLPEVVGDAGVLVEPDPEPLAAAMSDLLDNPALRSRLRQLGLARAATFSWQQTARLTRAAYDEAVTMGHNR